METNEAYACTVMLQANAAYDRQPIHQNLEVCRNPTPTKADTSIILEHNEAYKSMIRRKDLEPVIYEEVL